MNYHWSLESWGDAYPPENADEIINDVNDRLDAYAEQNGDEDAAYFSERLWEFYCTSDEMIAHILDNNLFDAAVQLMDDELRERVHADLAPCSMFIFLLEYMRLHMNKYGVPFVV